MNSSRPYMIRAIYEWVSDNGLTPYVMVDATFPHVVVPERFVEDGSIILNIASQAVGRLHLGNDAVEFEARFSGVLQHIYIPVMAVRAVYAQENGRGMVFSDDEDAGDEGPDDPGPQSGADSSGNGASSGKGRPTLRIVK